MPAWDAAREWVSDADGNRCSVAYFGSEAQAEDALRSLVDCVNCWNCSGCLRCSRCWDCSYCSRCSACSRCSDCKGCADCSDCSVCWDCSYCVDCTGCSNCTRCSNCWGCKGCAGCSGCAYCADCLRCSYCVDCTGCSGCSYCADCSDCKGCAGCAGCSDCSDLGEHLQIPSVPNIDKAIYAAASQPGALDMDAWHNPCGTSHCRAGWAVHLAGEQGYALEKRLGPFTAAMMIYRESGAPINHTRFFDNDEVALADMRRRAETIK